MYTYYDLLDEVNYLAHFGVETGVVGSSAGGKLIPYVHAGEKIGNQIIVTGAIHAREHVTALLVVKQIYATFNSGKKLDGGIYFVPIVNPDGNLLCSYGLAEFAAKTEELLKLNGGCEDFSLWKANLRGVDLNCNFDAQWATGVQNVFAPAAASYVGESAFSEAESRALRDFTLCVKPSSTISYHALGQEIYWQFNQSCKSLQRDRAFADYVNSFLNYQLICGTQGSAGGYKDWCIEKLGIPSLTIEVVNPSFTHPLTNRSVEADIEPNKFLPMKILDYLNSRA